MNSNYGTVIQSYQEDPDEFPELTIFRDILSARSLSPPYPPQNTSKKRLVAVKKQKPEPISPNQNSSISPQQIPKAASPPTPISSRLAPFNSFGQVGTHINNTSQLEVYNNTMIVGDNLEDDSRMSDIENANNDPNVSTSSAPSPTTHNTS